MRNLRNTKHTRYRFDEERHTGLSATAWDATDDSLVLAFGPSQSSPAITLKRLAKDAQDAAHASTIASWDAPSPNPDLEVDIILDLHCFPDTKTFSVVLTGGDIVIVRESPQLGEDLIEIVGSVDAGISAAAWSPDEELLAVATGAGTLLFMSRDHESVANIQLSPEDVKVSNHVSVGWGKKETQFKGRGVAKTLRDPTVPEHVDEGTISPSDEGKVTITWRGDGQYVAINSILGDDPRRRIIRVYSREGVLESVSEPVNGLEGALSWKPSGQTIAGVQRRDESIDIVFFERNGLRHGEFNLRLDQEEITTIGSTIELNWNIDSTVLAVSMTDRVQFWTIGNYHYYLKQEVLFDDMRESNASTMWHPEMALQVCCTTAGEMRRLSYTFEVCRGSVTPPHDIGLVAVVDGKKLKVTPLRTANIPPPVAFEEIELPDNALDVAIDESGKEIAVLHADKVSLWNCDYTSKPSVRATLKARIDVPKRYHSDTPGAKLLHGQLFVRTDHDRIAYIQATIPKDQPDHSPGNRPDIMPGPGKVTWLDADGDAIVFRLAASGVLAINGGTRSVSIHSCTSFVVTESYLIYTTGQHLLKFVHLHRGELEVPEDEPEKDERCRSIERGAKIVTVVPSAYSLVLQMPRGNLETIYPRALVLAGIRHSVRNRDYKAAFLTCRTHRVDMNILHDYAPEQFLRDLELFVKQLKKAEYMDLFLSSLSEDDVSQTMYRDTLAPEEKRGIDETVRENARSTQGVGQSKVNIICDAFLQVLQKQRSSKLQSIVTAHVCKRPPDLESGLRLVSELRKQGEQEDLEDAVEHICFLADVNELYDTALGLYDIDVALLVAQQSQKDPREYLPYLQSLQDMQPLRQHFSIDHDLKRHTKALTHLHALDDFDEFKTYTTRHELYAAAIKLCKYDEGRLNELMRIYADYLKSRNRYKEAAIAYEYILDHSSACEAYRAVNMWQECLANAALAMLPVAEMSNLAQDLTGSLEESKDFAAAATIHLDYLDDLKTAAALLCKAYMFAEAIRLVAMRQQAELLTSVVDPGLVDASATMTELLAEMKSQLGAQVPRLRDLRQKKADDPMAFLDGAEGADGDIPDNISLAPTDASTSGGTFMTRYTNRSMGSLATDATRKTSKNRRREERKRARGKKGTVYEEEYLVNSVARLIERLNSTVDDTTRLVEGLMRRSMRERAAAVQSAMDDVIVACKECMSEVFAPTGNSDEDGGQHLTNGEQPRRPWGGQGVLWETLTSGKQEAPPLKSFERLGLIA